MKGGAAGPTHEAIILPGGTKLPRHDRANRRAPGEVAGELPGEGFGAVEHGRALGQRLAFTSLLADLRGKTPCARRSLRRRFAEALSDDGSITGRGSPVLRGAICGLMTALGGIGHTLPYLVPNSVPDAFWIATAIAGVVVFCELWIIAFVRTRYMDTPFFKAALQIVLGGAIVLAAGILIGAS